MSAMSDATYSVAQVRATLIFPSASVSLWSSRRALSFEQISSTYSTTQIQIIPSATSAPVISDASWHSVPAHVSFNLRWSLRS